MEVVSAVIGTVRGWLLVREPATIEIGPWWREVGGVVVLQGRCCFWRVVVLIVVREWLLVCGRRGAVVAGDEMA